MICDSIISPHLCIATKGQRSRVCGKLFLSSVVPLVVNRGVHRDPNAIAAQRAVRFFPNTCQKMWGGKRVKVKKRRRQDILRFRAHAQKLILGSIGTPLDHLSFKLTREDVQTVNIHLYNLNFFRRNLRFFSPFPFPTFQSMWNFYATKISSFAVYFCFHICQIICHLWHTFRPTSCLYIVERGCNESNNM